MIFTRILMFVVILGALEVLIIAMIDWDTRFMLVGGTLVGLTAVAWSIESELRRRG